MVIGRVIKDYEKGVTSLDSQWSFLFFHSKYNQDKHRRVQQEGPFPKPCRCGYLMIPVIRITHKGTVTGRVEGVDTQFPPRVITAEQRDEAVVEKWN